MKQPSILVAGIGNIFLRDDGFGVAVVQRLAQRSLPPHVKIADFGIRGFDLGFELLQNYVAVILVDVIQRGGLPGTIYELEPDFDHALPDAAIVTHGMIPTRAIQFARGLGATLRQVRIVGCEPSSLEPSAGEILELTPPVQRAVEEAVFVIEELIAAMPQRDLSHA
ncbi:MAG: hydrogenase maturation protease [Verrucomicrobiota bacterium]